MYYARGIPKLYALAGFDGFKVNDSNRAAFDQAKIFCDNRGSRGLFLHGKRGCGKTHLACAIGNVHGRPIFVSSLDYILEIQEGFRKEWSTNEIVDDYAQGLLIFDDLGAELKPDRDNAFAIESVYALIDRRYRNKAWDIVITSNFSIDEISRNINDRIASRIVEMCVVVENGDVDRRLI